jgi:hypothetical protein
VPAGRSRVSGGLSPDGKWLAYGTNELGGAPFHVFVEPVPPTGAKHQISPEIASTPVWSPDGRRIYTAFAERIVAIDVTIDPQFSFGRATPIQTGSGIASSQSIRNFDLMPDGKQLLLLTPPTSANERLTAPQMNVVVSWFEDVKAKVR